MEPLEFAKGHGTGNDFVILPDPENRLTLTPELVSRLCDRRFGIGGDGVLRVVRGAEWFMDYRNADGSVAEICGNGVRVFVRYLVDTGLAAEPELVVGTRSGPVVAVVSDQAIRVTLARPKVYAESWAELDGMRLAGVAVDVGNPHLVCTLPVDRELADLDLTGAPQVDPELFPDGVNVEVVGGPVGPGQVRMRVYERGVGETLSCGSGACAVAAAVLHAAGRSGGVVTVDVPGGRLTVSLTGEECALTGPAVVVATGTVQVDALI